MREHYCPLAYFAHFEEDMRAPYCVDRDVEIIPFSVFSAFVVKSDFK